MLDFFGASETIVFSGAIVFMFLIGLLETIGLGSATVDLDMDAESPLAWLGLGEVPLLIVIVAFLATFGVIGLAGQQLFLAFTGGLAPALLAVPAAVLAALPATSVVARWLGRIIPRDETTAIDPSMMVGKTATILVGRAARGSPARARALDHFGQAHNLMVEPDNDEDIFGEGTHVLLVRREGNVFRAILHNNPRFSNWTN
ncbi:OB-fold-containig protein [uncultured Sphingosinicella sp.]|uniref:OB-fold-containig protein n=1 Tax=uncultured Sphingosinicella sp. TaxID=478748 RepID=UPI0030DAEAAC